MAEFRHDWVTDTARSPAADNRRVAERRHVAIPASLRRSGRTPFHITLRDLSRTGCRGETLSRLESGERIWVKLPEFAALEGMIRWVDGASFGCEWLMPLHPSIHDHISRAYPDFTAGCANAG